MLRYLIVLLVCVFGCSNPTKNGNELKCRTKFIDYIIHDFDGSNFLILEVRIDGRIEKVCLTNYEARSVFSRKYCLSEDQYFTMIRKVLKGQQVVDLTKDDISEKYFVIPDEEINRSYELGIDTLVARYFENNVQREIAIQNKNYLVSLLFDNAFYLGLMMRQG